MDPLLNPRDIAHDRFPTESLDKIRNLGFLTAPLPRRDGGRGWGTEAIGMVALSDAFRIIGYSSLALGRIYEAHVNAIALIFKYGGEQLRDKAREAVGAGQLFGLWVAPSDEPVRAMISGSRPRVRGRKAFCTAAGFASSAVITVRDERDDERMVLIDASQVQIDQNSTMTLLGMRNTSTKAVTMDLRVSPEDCFGDAGDYLREPDFSAGAWRTTAVTVGGLRALVDETIRQLRIRGRHKNPHQAARIGQMLIAYRSAAFWIEAVVRDHLARPEESADLTANVNLARLAVEQASLDIIQLVQRSLGLTSMTQSNPVEAMIRDLMTYLRQPAADEALSEAAITFAEATSPTTFGL